MHTIDIHIHGINGIDTRTTSEQDILKLAEIQASCGVSEIIPTIYPDTIEVMRGNILAVKRAMEIQKEQRNWRASILGVNLEGPFLNTKKCGALNSASFIEATEYNQKKLLDGFEDIVKIITIAPEISGALELIKLASEMGIIVSMGHSNASYAEAEAGFHAGAKSITHLFNAMSGFHHREPGLAGFGLLNNEIYTEVIADPYHLHPKTMELIFRTKNPERIILVSDTIKSSRAEEQRDRNGQPLSMNVRGAVTKIPSPLTGEGQGGGELRTPPHKTGTLLGGAMTITDASKRLIDLGYDSDLITACISNNPAKYLCRLINL